jgi:hypothetical protein
MLNILKNLKRSTKVKLMISLLLFLISTVCLFNQFFMITTLGYFLGGCLIGDSLADETN